MQFKILSVIALVAFASCSSSNKIAGIDKGFTPIFDSKTLSGWHTYGQTEAGKAWEVSDGTLFLNTNLKEGRGDLVTDKEYENYHFKLEWKIAEGANSGVIFNVHEDKARFGATYSSGPEMQIIDNDKHPDAKNHTHRSGDLYDMIASKEEVARPVGEWNKAEIVSNRGKLDFYLNGVHIVSTTMFDENWKNLIAKSKFATWPGFGTFTKGKIALQDHGDKIWFRNIQIKEL